MRMKSILSAGIVTIIVFIYSVTACAAEAGPVRLPPPGTTGGKALMQALKDRKSSREFSPKELPLQIISDMLWAANGINRPDSAHRTAPSARNMQEIDVYVAMAAGLYLYDAKDNMLSPVLKEDIRALTGSQGFVKDAPVSLIYVADLSKMGKMPADLADFYSATDTGFVSENVYLYCASAGLVTVVRGMVDRAALARAMKLRPDQKIILAQTVGYPRR